MESIHAKRKVRRTRRNLNEKRKRAYQITNKTFNTKFDTNIGLEKKRDPFKPIISITNDRLTLCNKTVTSETITRSFVRKAECTDRGALVNAYCHYDCINNEDEYHTNEKSDRKTKDRVSSDINLFRHLKKVNITSDSSDTDQNNSFRFAVKSDSLSSGLQPDNMFVHDYERFMNDIPKYISETAPILLRTDIIEKKAESLKKLYLEFNNDQTNKSEFTNGFISSSSENILDNSISCSECSYSKSEIIDIKDASSSANNFSSLTTCPSPTTLYTIDCDSPEHLYYPHKLNDN